MGWGPHGLGLPWVGGTHGLGAPIGSGLQRVTGRVYETKPIITVFFVFFISVSLKECSLKKQFFLHTLN
jgi:hypothetical protein